MIQIYYLSLGHLERIKSFFLLSYSRPRIDISDIVYVIICFCTPFFHPDMAGKLILGF